MARYFDAPTPTLGSITKWMPPAPRAREPALFRAVHDDGDLEDLDEHPNPNPNPSPSPSPSPSPGPGPSPNPGPNPGPSPNPNPNQDLEEEEAREAVADYTQLLRLAREGTRRS